MTDNIDRIHIIDRSALSGKNYFTTLMEQARRCAVMGDDDAARITEQSFFLVAELTEKMTGGKSSSVRAETARELLESALYSAGVALKTYPSPEDAVRAMCANDVKSLFERGQKLIFRKLQTAKMLHKRIKSNLFCTPNVFYRSTIIAGIDGFFKLYKPAFSGHEIHITADYPTFFEVADLTGVEFILQYLQNIDYENRFCLNFDPERADRFMRGINRDYRLSVMNIYEPLLISAICRKITNCGTANGFYCDTARLGEIIRANSEQSFMRLAQDAALEVASEFDCAENVRDYVLKSVPLAAKRILNAHKCGRLTAQSGEFVYEPYEKSIAFSYGERMDSAKYTELLERVMREEPRQRAKIILDGVKSFADLTDAVHDSELDAEQSEQIIRALPPEIIAALCAHYRGAEIWTEGSDRIFYAALNKFLSGLPREQAEIIKKAADAIHPET